MLVDHSSVAGTGVVSVLLASLPCASLRPKIQSWIELQAPRTFFCGFGPKEVMYLVATELNPMNPAPIA